MRPRERRESGEQDLFRSRLDQVINMNHALVKLARTIDWRFLEEKFSAIYKDGPGQPPLPTRLMAGLAILKHTYNLSDEVVCELWIENPYYQYFCGEEFFQHRLPLDRSSISNWRNRMGEERLQALLQESLAVATKSGAMKPGDLARIIVDTTVQPKNITFPTDAKLLNRAREKLVKLAKKLGVELRQSYARVGKFTLIKHQRYAHARQFNRAKRALRRLKTYLGRVMRDIARKIAGDEALRQIFAHPLMLAGRVHTQNKNLRPIRGQPPGADLRVFSLHAPEVECIGKGKAHKPYEFGVKASVATTLKHSKGGQFIVHARTLPGKPYDGHTLGVIIPEIERLVGAPLDRIVADRGYRGHNAPLTHRFKVYISGQKRRVTESIKRELRRRAAVEPVIGHMKAEHRMGRNYLAHATGDAINAVLAAVGCNFRRLLAWLAFLLSAITLAIANQNLPQPDLSPPKP